MSKGQTREIRQSEHPAFSLLKYDHQAISAWLHDELAQNLVAIKSFANMLAEPLESPVDVSELAEMIHQAASNAYNSSYQLMQEFRAEEFALRDIEDGLNCCLHESRLKESGIEYQLNLTPTLTEPDQFNKVILLHSLRTFINFSKHQKQAENLGIELGIDSESHQYNFILRLKLRSVSEPQASETIKLNHICQRIKVVGGYGVFSQQADYLVLALSLPVNHLTKAI